MLARRMTGPIHRLQEGAARIGGGELTGRIEIATRAPPGALPSHQSWKQSEVSGRKWGTPMSTVLLDFEVVRQRFAALPTETYQAGDVVLADGTTTGKVLVLKEGAVEVVKDGVQLCEVAEAGAVFGEISALLGEAHTADVRAVRPTTFHVADAVSFLAADGTVALYVATLMARRLKGSNAALLEVKKQLEAGQPRSAIRRMLDRIIEGYSTPGDPNYAYAIVPWM
jgi:CRP-like cAMP-binding protein